jgi:hypothetical protein
MKPVTSGGITWKVVALITPGDCQGRCAGKKSERKAVEEVNGKAIGSGFPMVDGDSLFFRGCLKSPKMTIDPP